MPADTIHEFAPDDERRAVIAECTESYDVGSPQAEWPNNLISNKVIVYGSGRVARAGETVRHAVDPAELALCRRLAAEAAALMKGTEVGMGSEDSNEFRPFYVVANKDEPAPARITGDFVRKLFGGTIFPPATITVEPLAERGKWWSEVMADFTGEDEDEDEDEEGDSAGGLDAWRKMIAWFKGRAEFRDAAFVRIGDFKALHQLKRDRLPPGTEVVGCVLPRLAIGLTRAGSVAGVFGHSVQT
jgi:hypothetical protein